jgi:hypothetical protein
MSLLLFSENMDYFSCAQNMKLQKLTIFKIENMKLRLITAKLFSFNQTISNFQTEKGGNGSTKEMATVRRRGGENSSNWETQRRRDGWMISFTEEKLKHMRMKEYGVGIRVI